MENIVLNGQPVVRSGEHAQLLDLGDGIACVRFLSKGNSLTPHAREFLSDAVENSLYGFDGLVIANSGKHFSVGADLANIKARIDAGAFSGFAERCVQKLVTAIKHSKKPIVAAPFGMTLGGGLEVVLHTHARAALRKSFMGLVEVGVGLIPGGGGTKETALLVGRSLENGRQDALKAAFHKLLLRTVSSDAEHARELGYLTISDTIRETHERLVGEAKAQCMKLIASGFLPPKPSVVRLPGLRGYKLLLDYMEQLLESGDISPYDAVIGRQLAVVLCGSDTKNDVVRTEGELMLMENDCFINLVKSRGTYDRISYFLKTKGFLRN